MRTVRFHFLFARSFVSRRTPSMSSPFLTTLVVFGQPFALGSIRLETDSLCVFARLCSWSTSTRRRPARHCTTLARRMGNPSLCKSSYRLVLPGRTLVYSGRLARSSSTSFTTAPQRRGVDKLISYEVHHTQLITDLRGSIVVQSVRSSAFFIQISISSFSHCPSNPSPAGARLP